MNNDKKILLLIGKSAVGKDTILKEILKQNSDKLPLKKAVSVTTRPKRLGEIDGEDYYFITEKEFLDDRNNNEFIEETHYEVGKEIWRYGFQKKEFLDDTNYLIVANPNGFRAFFTAYRKGEIDKKVVPIYLICDEEERKRRYLKRDKNNPNILSQWKARLQQDFLDFDNSLFGIFSLCEEFHVFDTEKIPTEKIAKEVLGLI